MHGNRHTRTVALGKVIALEHARYGITRCQLNHATCTERITPLAVVTHFGFTRVKHEAGLFVIGLGIFGNGFCRQWWARCISAGRIANHAREIANQENHGMAQVLQLPQLIQNHRMPQMNIRRSRV